MNRDFLGQYISAQFAPLITVCQVNAVDDLSGYQPALDSVMRMLNLDVFSVTANPDIDPGLEGDAILLTRYYTLEWLLYSLALQRDNRTADEQSSDSQRFKQVMLLYNDAKEKVPSQYPITSGDFTLGRIQLDILEPWYADGFLTTGTI